MHENIRACFQIREVRKTFFPRLIPVIRYISLLLIKNSTKHQSCFQTHRISNTRGREGGFHRFQKTPQIFGLTIKARNFIGHFNVQPLEQNHCMRMLHYHLLSYNGVLRVGLRIALATGNKTNTF